MENEKGRIMKIGFRVYPVDLVTQDVERAHREAPSQLEAENHSLGTDPVYSVDRPIGSVYRPHCISTSPARFLWK